MEKIIAKHLLDIKAVFLRPNEPFTWASGITSPIYCDNRLTLSFPHVRHVIEHNLAKTVLEKFPSCNYIMGTATAGIAHAAIVADILGLPMGYVRSSSKSHGRTNQIEGAIIPGKKVVIIEDLISTGGSSIAVVETLQSAGFDVLGVVSIFSYELPDAVMNFSQAGVPYVALSTYDVLVEVAIEHNYIDPADLQKLKQWKSNPHDHTWSL